MRTRSWALIAGGCFLLIVAFSIAGQLLESELANDEAAYQRAGTIAMLVGGFLVFALGFSLVPVMVHAVLLVQVRLGNAEVPWISFLLQHESTIVRLMWALMLVGAAIALVYLLGAGAAAGATSSSG